MNAEQAKLLSHFVDQFADLAKKTLLAYTQSDNAPSERPQPQKTQPKDITGLLTASQLAELLKVSTRTISNLKSDGMPFVLVKKSVRYEYRKCLEWIESEKIKVKGRRKTALRIVR